MNNICIQYCMDLIRCLIQEKPIPDMPEGVVPEELYTFAKLHSVEAMVWHGLEQLDLDENNPVWKNWRSRADMLLTQSMVQLAERDILFARLPSVGISILPVKGCWLKEQYPEIDYRQMSDLDFLLHPEDREQAEDMMLQMGYTNDSHGADNHAEFIKPPYMGVELHHALLPLNDEHSSYYEDIWERVVPADGYSRVFRLKPEDEYIFYFVHLYKHVFYAGTGIRSFMDSLVYRRIWPDMNRDYLQKELEKLNLTDFAQFVETVTDCWFETGTPVPAEMAAMADSVLASGTYGTDRARIRNEISRISGNIRNPYAAKFIYLLSRLFLPLRLMQPLYPVLNKAPVLLPVFWVWRLLSRLLFRPKALTNLIKHTNEEGDKLWSEDDWQEFRSK